MKYVVPMLESERGWGQKIDGYAGPFETLESAVEWAREYNQKHNDEKSVPDWYMVALTPQVHTNQKVGTY